MNVCPECSTQIPDESAFCPFCGTQLSKYSTPPVPAPAKQPKKGVKLIIAAIIVLIVLGVSAYLMIQSNFLDFDIFMSADEGDDNHQSDSYGDDEGEDEDEDNDDEPDNTDDITESTEGSFDTEEIESGESATEPEAPKHDDPFADIEYAENLTEEDKAIIMAIFDQREMWETKQDEETEPYTRNAVEACGLRFFYDGNHLYFNVGYLLMQGNHLLDSQNSYQVDDMGSLTKVPVEPLYYTGGIDNIRLPYSDGTYSVSSDEELKLSELCKSYAGCKEKRQAMFGDAYPVEIADWRSQLSIPAQVQLYDSLFATMSEWEVYDFGSDGNRGCTSIGIWIFDDWTAEILCFYPDLLTPTRGYTRGFYIDGTSITELSNAEESRLLNDLNNDSYSNLEWSVPWSQEKKEAEMYYYVQLISGQVINYEELP